MIPETEGRAGMNVADSLTAKSRENLTEFSLRKKNLYQVMLLQYA